MGEKQRLTREQASKRARQSTITDTLRNRRTPPAIRNRAMAEKDKFLDELPQITYKTPSAEHIYQDTTGLNATGGFASEQQNGLWNAYCNGGQATADIYTDPDPRGNRRLLYRTGQRISAEHSDSIGENMRRLQLKIGDATSVDGGAGGDARNRFDDMARDIRRDSLDNDVNINRRTGLLDPRIQIHGAYRGRWRGSNFA
jgi:hypothetical protein